jgi:hypothetical protein
MKKLLKYLCPHTWFKKREIVFYGNYPHVDKTNPIVKSLEIKRSWMKKAKEHFNEKLLNEKKYSSIASGHRCLGIQSLIEQGFVLKNEKEFAVETNGNDDDIKIHTPNNTIPVGGESDGFSFFSSNLLGDYTRPKNAIKHMIKINLSWHLVVPKDVVILYLPFNYSDDDRFMGSSAILDPVFSSQVNVSLWWFARNSYEIVRKGTPLAQIIPIPKKSICESWRMVDKIPDKLQNIMSALNNVRSSTKCAMYSEYKKIANQLHES